jgi:enoyl-CoA hydratase/carnithine racemase
VSARNSTVRCEVQNNVALITLDRQEAANSIDLNLARELMHTVLRCGDDPAVRAVAVTNRGSTFCVGGDLRSFAAQGERLSLHLKEVTIYLHPTRLGRHGYLYDRGCSRAFAALRSVSVPILASFGTVN